MAKEWSIENFPHVIESTEMAMAIEGVIIISWNINKYHERNDENNKEKMKKKA